VKFMNLLDWLKSIFETKNNKDYESLFPSTKDEKMEEVDITRIKIKTMDIPKDGTLKLCPSCRGNGRRRGKVRNQKCTYCDGKGSIIKS